MSEKEPACGEKCKTCEGWNPKEFASECEDMYNAVTLRCEKEVSEKEIDQKLDEIILGHQDHFIRLMAKLIFNLRYDLNDLKLELLKVLKDDDCKVNHKKEEEDGRFYS